MDANPVHAIMIQTHTHTLNNEANDLHMSKDKKF